MSAPILATKLYIPPPRPRVVPRPHLIERLNEGLHHRLTLISAPAGFGKTTLASEWVAAFSQDPAAEGKAGVMLAWLSLDEGDNDLLRFLTYLVAALQTVNSEIGEGVVSVLQSPQPPSTESILTVLLNEISALSNQIVFVLDDYHVVDSKLVDQALLFLLEHLPPQMHLVIVTREDPQLPLARLRVRGQLTELRVTDLRFTPAEAAQFLNQVMGLNLSAEDINALDARTEGWIAGLQLAAISMQAHPDTTSFIQSFTGSHHFVLDYLLTEVLNQQPDQTQNFLLRTAILERLCAPLCEAVLQDTTIATQEPFGQKTLEYLERSNLFIVPLDSERFWYRYHHLFGDLLRQRLKQTFPGEAISEDHIRASEWYENNDLLFEAFQHAIAANDIERAERLTESKGMPLHVHSISMAIVDWLLSLPKPILNARPWLWVKSCTLALMAGQTTGVEKRLQAAENALQNLDPVLISAKGLDQKIRDQTGQIACARATLALTRYQPEEMIIQARRALEYLHPDNLIFRFTANWALATASMLQGDRAAAAQAAQEALSLSQKSGDIFSITLALSDLGQIQELDNQYHQAFKTYQGLLPLFGDHPQPNASEVYLGLARISYEWNDLEAAERYGELSLQLARQYDTVIDRFIISEVFLARLKLAQGDVDGAAALLAQSEQIANQKNFLLRMPEISVVKVLILLQQGNLAAAAQIARHYELPLSQARVLLAQGDSSAALATLEPFRQQMEARGWADEQLKALILQSVALYAHGDREEALRVLGGVLALTESGGFIRSFLDEGAPMAQLLQAINARGGAPEYTRHLLSAFSPAILQQTSPALNKSAIPDPLSERELEVLQYIAEGFTNHEIATQLYLSLYTVKAHVRNIFRKLDVTNRTQAVTRARELGILHQS